MELAATASKTTQLSDSMTRKGGSLPSDVLRSKRADKRAQESQDRLEKVLKDADPRKGKLSELTKITNSEEAAKYVEVPHAHTATRAHTHTQRDQHAAKLLGGRRILPRAVVVRAAHARDTPPTHPHSYTHTHARARTHVHIHTTTGEPH